MMHRFKVAVLALFLLFPAGQCLAEMEKPVVWGFSDYPPFKYKEAGEYKGIDVLLMNEVASRLGIKIKFSDCPFKRCLELMKSGGVDFMTAIGLREERKAFVEFIFPPYNEKNTKLFYIKKGTSVKIDKYEDVYKYTIGVKNGVSYFPQFDNDPSIKKQTVNEVEINLRKLAQSRIDAAMNTEIQMDYLILKHGFEGEFEKSGFRDDSGRDFIGISKESPLLKRKVEIETIVADMVKTGRTQAIVTEFFDQIRKQVLDKPKPASQPATTPAPIPK